MFDVDQFVTDCLEAVSEHEPRLAIKEVLERAVSDPAGLEPALTATRADSSRSTSRTS